MYLEKLNQFLETLDEKSRAIVLFMAKNRHARIRELSDLVGAKNDAYILMKIREVINPVSEEILGEPSLHFEKSSIDRVTGEKVLFSWHLNECLDFLKSREMLDVFDEGRYLKVVTEFPDIDEGDLRFDLKPNVLRIMYDGTERAIPLPNPAKCVVENSYRNNVLEIKLEKLTGGFKHAETKKGT